MERVGETRNADRCFGKTIKETGLLEDSSLRGKTILKWT